MSTGRIQIAAECRAAGTSSVGGLSAIPGERHLLDRSRVHTSDHEPGAETYSFTFG
jgi:hypothetical protein